MPVQRVRTSGDGVGLEDLPVLVLLQVGAGPVQDTGAAHRQGRRVLAVQTLQRASPESKPCVSRQVPE